MSRKLLTGTSLFFLVVVTAVPALAAEESRFEMRRLAALSRPLSAGTRVKVDGIPIADKAETLDLEAFEVWAPGAEVTVESDGGVRTRLPIPDIHYFRGTVAGDPDSMVVLSIRQGDQATDGLIISGERRFTVRSRATRTDKGQWRHDDVYVRELDVLDEMPLGEGGFSCDLEGQSFEPAHRLSVGTTGELAVAPNGALSATGTFTLNLAIETDYEMYVKFGANGSSVANITAWVGSLVAAGSTIYQRDLRTDLLVSYLNVHTSSSDPFTINPGSSGLWNGSSTTYSTSHALAELGDRWHNSAPSSAPRSSVILLSGKSQAAGVAWLARSCTSDFLCSNGNCNNPIYDGHYGGGYAYCGGVGIASGAVPDPNATNGGVQYGLPPSNYWSLLALTHELGHNVNGRHTHCISLTAAEQTQYNVPGRPYIDLCLSGGGTGCYDGTASIPAEKGTIMSYCHLFFSGGLPQSRFLFGRSTEPSQKIIDAILGTPLNPGYLRTVTPDTPAISAPSSMSPGSSSNASIVGPVAGLTYTWTAANATINGSNTGTSINFTANTNPVTLRVRGTNASGCAASDYVTITVAGCTAPAITVQPLSQPAIPGLTLTLSVAATGSSLTYQWYRGPSGNTSSPIGGATSSVLNTPVPLYAQSYWVRVSNGCGSANSAAAFVTPRQTVTRNGGDYDGDGLTDVAIFRPGNARWYITNSSNSSIVDVQWGFYTDIQTPGDYDGDGRTDQAVWRPENGTWYIRYAAGGTLAVQWGLTGDIPIPADYDGDGDIDPAVFRPNGGMWFIIGPSGAYAVQWGVPGDIPVPADYNGDGRADIAIFRPSDGRWFIRYSESNVSILVWGQSGDLPVPGDYSGDGIADLAIFRPSSSVWLISTPTGTINQPWGVAGDVPVPGDFNGDGRIEIAVWRPASGIWYIRDAAVPGGYYVRYWGVTGDTPLTN